MTTSVVKPLVSVIIPVYNKQDMVARAIDSIDQQTYPRVEVIVVDDGSTDASADAAKKALDKATHLESSRYVYQENAGVAIARNTGVFTYSSGQLILCLDADDAVGPRYLELLVPALWSDRELGVVYTGLIQVHPDGTETPSRWPGHFDAEAHFYKRFNQVPTAALARKEVWRRLGGQRQRYAPNGAGAEDGDFWLRAGAFGFGIKYVHPKWGRKCAFLYSIMQGAVSGNRQYREVDWRSWSPWTKNHDLMPIASIAPAKRFSHPGRRYDEPSVSVIIPVGPGHTKYLVDSLDSLEAQTIKKWEAIVIFDVDEEEWVELEIAGTLDYIFNAWPFCRFTSTHAAGKFARDIVDTIGLVTDKYSGIASLPAGKPYGAGYARNIGIRAAIAPLLLFLDADDYLMPTALEKMIHAYRKEKKIIFSEHYGIAPIKEDNLNQVLGRVVFYNEKKEMAVIHQRVKDYDCEEAAKQPYTDGRDPYVICNVSSLIPKKWAVEIGGFPTDLPSFEDVLFWWEQSWNGRCFYRIDEPLLVYRYHTGFRRELGRQNARDLLSRMKKVREGFKDMGCGCTKAPGAGTIINSYGAIQAEGESMATLNLSRGSKLAVDDGDLMLVEFSPPDRGDKLRFGQHDFGGGNFIKYGRLSGGEQIFVHVLDFEAENSISRAQNRSPIYHPIEMQVTVEEEQQDLPDKPVDLAFTEGDSPILIEAEPTDTEFDFPEPIEDAWPPRLTPLDKMDLGDMFNPSKYIAILRENGIYVAYDIILFINEHEEGLQAIDGIGPKAAEGFENAARALI